MTGRAFRITVKERPLLIPPSGARCEVALIRPIRSLEQVIAGCLRHDNGSKEWLYRSYFGYLMGVMIRYTRSRPDAEELVNDSFVKIFRNLPNFAFPADAEHKQAVFKAWIARIAARTAIDHLRIDKNKFWGDELPDDDLHADPVNVLDTLNARDILSLLDELPELQRVIFNMFEVEGYSHEEIAQETGIPIKNSRVYLARAKSKLRSLYQKNFQTVGHAS